MKKIELNSYESTKEIVNQRIKDKLLPAGYKLPQLHTFVIPKLEKDQEYIFVPKGLKFDHWDKLLSQKDGWNGLWISSNYKDFSGSGWELWAVNTQSKPTEVSITHTEAITKYGELLSVEAYLATQWFLLESDREPIDELTITWLQNDPGLKVVPSGHVPGGFWDPFFGRVRLYWDVAGRRYDAVGVRFVGRGLALESSSLLEPSTLEEN